MIYKWFDGKLEKLEKKLGNLKCDETLSLYSIQCDYCGVNQEELYKIKDKRKGNFTLNPDGVKCKNGTMEIDRKYPNIPYKKDVKI